MDNLQTSSMWYCIVTPIEVSVLAAITSPIEGKKDRTEFLQIICIIFAVDFCYMCTKVDNSLDFSIKDAEFSLFSF